MDACAVRGLGRRGEVEDESPLLLLLSSSSYSSLLLLLLLLFCQVLSEWLSRGNLPEVLCPSLSLPALPPPPLRSMLPFRRSIEASSILLSMAPGPNSQSYKKHSSCTYVRPARTACVRHVREYRKREP